MHDGGAAGWREIVDRSHARLVDELGARIDLDRARAIEIAVAAERERAARHLQSELAKLNHQLDSERERLNSEFAALREHASTELSSERERARKELDSARQELASVREASRKECDAAVENARRELGSERDRTRSEVADASAKARLATRQATAEALNQALRRIRQTTTTEATLDALADLASSCSQRLVVLVFENNQARVAAARGIRDRNGSEGTASNGMRGASAAPAGPPNGTSAVSNAVAEAFEITLEGAPALAAVIETRDPVTVLAKESEVSAALVRLMRATPSERLYLFPVAARQQVVAMLVVAGEVFAAAPELLTEAAGMRLESLSAVPKESKPSDLVRIQRAAVPASATSDRRTWEDLSPEDQQVHLQAQRVARVRVAKMRLDREDAWRRGLAQSDVYSALRREIESARTEFLQTFLSNSSTMVDYLHLEILRSLANDDDRVLGREYPGPMV